MMKINKIREMSSPELEKELVELKSELFKLRFSLATNGLDNPMKIKEVKKDIARVNTILKQRELGEAKKLKLVGDLHINCVGVGNTVGPKMCPSK